MWLRGYLLLCIGFWLPIHRVAGQRTIFYEQAPRDTSYTIQFAELRDSTHTFQGLHALGKIMIEHIPSKGLFRYSLGYYADLTQAELILKALRAKGLMEAFLKKHLILPPLPSDIIGINKDNNTNTRNNIANINSKDNPVNPSIKSNSADTTKNNTGSTTNSSSTSTASTSNDTIPTTKSSETQRVNKGNVTNTPNKNTTINTAPKKVSTSKKKPASKVLPAPPLAKDTASTLSAASKAKEVHINLLYTGKSFGVLGNIRFQSEHEMATEFAVENNLKFKLVSHACWRAQGITVFLPSDEPDGSELDLILNERSKWEALGPTQAYATHNALLVQNYAQYDIDMLHILLNNKKVPVEYPEIKKVPVKLYRTFIKNKMECLIVEEADAVWPAQRSHWSMGEINRVDFGTSDQLFELPLNQGGFGQRASIIKTLTTEIKNSGGHALNIDLGHRNADFLISPMQRGRIDLTGLDSLGYSILVPYEFEFLLGADSLNSLIKEHPSLSLMASNVRSPKYPALFTPYKFLVVDSIRIGLMALADPTMETNLPGKILKDLKFEDILSAATKVLDSLRRFKPDIIIALSNMTTSDHARLAENIKGIHLISANFTDHALGWTTSKELMISQDEKQGAGAPYEISSIRDFGIEVGRIEMKFIRRDTLTDSRIHSITTKSYKVSDRLPADVGLVEALTSKIPAPSGEHGELLFPAFIDLIEQNPELANIDETTRKGRMSKPLWEKFIARLLTEGAPAEIAIIRKIPTFLPLIGKLHEREVRSWLWFEDEIVMMDMKGADIIRLLEADNDHALTTNGIETVPFPGGVLYRIMGRPVQNDVYYRVATTNVISNGVLKEYFREGLREEVHFEIQKNGELKGIKHGSALSLRDYVLSELKRIRSYGKGKEHHRRIAELLVPKILYQKLFSFNFDRPTLWTSLNRTYKGEGYDAIPESRIISENSFVIGTEGGFLASLDKERSELNFGARMAFAQQSLNLDSGLVQKTENADDINFNITYKLRGRKRTSFRPYTRMEYDSEFTPTLNRATGLENSRQKILRNVIGISRGRTLKWPVLELGLHAENDFSNSNYQYGIQGRSFNRFPLDKNWNVLYSLTNNFYYYLPNANDSERDLSIKYNMVHEVLIPLFGDISLSMAADLFFFKGKTAINKEPGMSMLMKVGLTYNRLWKPKFQTLF